MQRLFGKFNKNLKSISYVSIGIILGRIAGFFKHFFIVKYFGITYEADVFFVANTITEMAINIVLAGMLTGAFIPIASEIFVKYGNRKFSEFIKSSFVIIGGIQIISALILYVFSYEVSQIIAPGFSESQKLIISNLFKILSPGILFIGLAAILRGTMNVLESFLVPSLGLFVANGSMILTTILFYKKWGIMAPAIGTSLGFFLWFIMHLPFTYKYFLIKSKINIFDTYLKRLLRNSIPAIGMIFFSNVILIIEKAVASQYLEGTVSELNLAFRLGHIFLSVLILPLTTVLLPKMSKCFGLNNIDGIYALAKKGLQIVTIMLFCFLTIIILNDCLITRLVYGLTGISSSAINIIAKYLTVYSFAIATLFLYMIFMRVLYSIQKPAQLLIANILGVITYTLTTILLNNLLRSYVLPLAYFVYAITITSYLFIYLKRKIFLSYPPILNKPIFFYGLFFMVISLLSKFCLYNSNYLLHILSVIFIIGYLSILWQKGLLKGIDLKRRSE